METFLPLLIILFLVILPLLARRKRAAAVRQFLNRKKQNKESNEMKELAKRPDYEVQMEQILRMMIAESTVRFEQLPCLVDVDILRNILYDGVWNHYNKIQMKKREEKNDDKKSI